MAPEVPRHGHYPRQPRASRSFLVSLSLPALTREKWQQVGGVEQAKEGRSLDGRRHQT